MTITKQDLKELKEELRSFINKIQELQETEDFAKLESKDGSGWKESAKLSTEMWVPRAEWYISKINDWIEKAPAGKRGRKKKS